MARNTEFLARSGEGLSGCTERHSRLLIVGQVIPRQIAGKTASTIGEVALPVESIV